MWHQWFNRNVMKLREYYFTSSHLHIRNWVKGYVYLACCPRRGLRARLLARTQNAPPSAPPSAGVETGWRWGVGGVEGCLNTRDNAGKTALIIYRDSLSCWLDRWCDYWWWIGHVNYLRVLLPKCVNKTSLVCKENKKKHIFIQQFLLFQVSLHHHLREYHDACVWCLLF